MIIIMSENV